MYVIVVVVVVGDVMNTYTAVILNNNYYYSYKNRGSRGYMSSSSSYTPLIFEEALKKAGRPIQKTKPSPKSS